ncbi:hypothetical protein BH23PLA1_BH23PLA1_09410 [soil metagenome]
MKRTDNDQRPIDRRTWLAAIGLGPLLLFGRGRASRQEPEIKDRLEGLGLGTIQERQTRHYLGAGNAPPEFIEAALKLCEGLAEDYLRHFPARGFAVQKPARLLQVVVLSDSESFAKVLGEDPGETVAGIYDLDANELVMFDNRGASTGDAQADFGAQRANSIALFHEATHQLTYNTGLLDRESDVPVLISEGLATYGEVRRPDGRTRIGAINQERLSVIAQALRQGEPLLPVERLLTEGALFLQADTLQLAYAQAWLLAHAHFSNKGPAERFRIYLEALKKRPDGSSRLEDFQAHLGDPEGLDKQLMGLAKRMVGR